jgi:hypothetical protein
VSRPFFDLSFLNPQALSRNSWILQVPPFRGLGSRAASWNSLWVETFDLVTPERPEVCEKLIDDALPRWLLPNQRWIAGYVWRGGFTIYRLTAWHNSFRAMGTGTLSSESGVTQIHFRVGSNRLGVYALALLSALFVLFGVAMIVATVRGSTPAPFALIAVVIILIPLALFVAAGRKPARDGERSEEADRLVEIVADLLGAQEVAGARRS